MIIQQMIRFLTTESFVILCKKCDLQREDLEIMTIGMCFDYIEEFIEMTNPSKTKSRAASQTDFDNF